MLLTPRRSAEPLKVRHIKVLQESCSQWHHEQIDGAEGNGIERKRRQDIANLIVNPVSELLHFPHCLPCNSDVSFGRKTEVKGTECHVCNFAGTVA